MLWCFMRFIKRSSGFVIKKKKALNRTQQRKKLSAHSAPSLPFSHAWDRTQPWNFLTSEGISLGIIVEVISVWRSAWVISMEIYTPVVLRFVRSCSDLCFDSWDHGCRRRSGRGSWLWCLFCRGAGFLFLSWVAVGFYLVSIFVFWVVEFLICKVLDCGYWLWRYRCLIRGFGLPVLVGFGCVFWVWVAVFFGFGFGFAVFFSV